MTDSGSVAIRGFDYAAITDKNDRTQLQGLADQIRKDQRIGILHWMSTGKSLVDAHRILSRQKVGIFAKYAKSLGFSKSSAYRAMSVYAQFSKVDVSILARIEPTALISLSNQNTPRKACNDAVRLAEKGVSVTNKDVRELIANCTFSAADTTSAAKEGNETGSDMDGGKEAPAGFPSYPKPYQCKHSGCCHDDTIVCACGQCWYFPSGTGYECDNCGRPMGEPMSAAPTDRPLGDLEMLEMTQRHEREFLRAKKALANVIQFCFRNKITTASTLLQQLANELVDFFPVAQ